MPLAALAACGAPDPAAPPDPQPAPAAAPSPAAPPPRPAARVVLEGGEPVTVDLAFTGVGRLHRGFFSQQAPLAELASALGPCVAGDVTVRVTWEDAIRLGHIALEVAPNQLRCAPVAADGGLDLAPLEPVGRALAAYRDAIAAGYDFRVASFRGEVRLDRADADCLLRLGGQFPPDGSRWHRCVEVGGRAICADDPAGDGLVRVVPPAAADQAALVGCLTP